MSITVSKYHHIGNERLVEYLAKDPADGAASAQLQERGYTGEQVDQEVTEKREELGLVPEGTPGN